MTTPTTVNVQFQLRADTAANWTAENPTLLANEFALETDTKKLKVGDGSTAWASLAYFPSIVSGGTVLGNLEIGSTGTLTFEGSTANDYETTLAVTDPTADRTITLPDQSGTVVVSGNASIVDADIAAGAEIAVSKLANGTANQVLVTDGTDVSWSDDLTIAGNLTVNGTTTTVNTQTLVVEDKNIELGVVGTPTDLTADGGGITLKGTTDKTINWVDSTDAWTSSERFSVPLGSAASPSLTFTGDENSGLYSPGADQVAISTAGTGRLFVDASGNVSFPSSVTIDTTTGNLILGADSSNASGASAINFTVDGSEACDINNTGYIRFSKTNFGGGGVCTQELDSALNLGGGNNTLNSGLNIALSGPSRVSDIGYLMRWNTTSLYGWDKTNDFHYWNTGGSERLRITSDGSIGVGTASPSQRLHVNSGSANTVALFESTDAGAAIQLKDSGSTNFNGIQAETHDLLIYANGGEKARIDSSGRLLVGTSSARTVSGNISSLLQVEGTSGTANGVTVINNTNTDDPAFIVLGKSRGTALGSNTAVQNNDYVGEIRFAAADGTDMLNRIAQISAIIDGSPGTDDTPGRLVFSTTADGASSPTERMRIQANGSILFADDDAAGIIAGSVNGKMIEAGSIMRSSRATTSNATHIGFYNSNGLVGQISTSASATSYATSSDYRLKENITAVTDGITRLQQLKPSRFNFIADPDTTVDGFLAHEVQTVVPEAITGEKDAVDDEGNPQYQGIDQSKLVPLLTAALQEAIGEIESLKARVAALETP